MYLVGILGSEGKGMHWRLCRTMMAVKGMRTLNSISPCLPDSPLQLFSKAPEPLEDKNCVPFFVFSPHP